jgi:peptidoglycan-N-acetylglucosamine deacetylase
VKFARRVNWMKRAAWRLVGCVSKAPLADGILLTFDDGPHPEHTPTVLGRLAKFNLTAAFFIVGKRIADLALVQHIADAGHILGNHTFSHETPRWSDIRVSLADVAKCQELVPGARLFRPPLGKLTPGLWLAARRQRLRCVNWSLDSGDWRCRSESDAAICAAEVLKLVRPGDVLLFHDDHRWIGPILDAVLPGFYDPDGAHAFPSTSSTILQPRT